MLTRERRSPVSLPVLPDYGRTGRKGAARPILPPAAALPPLTSALSRRAALFGAVTVAGVSVAAVVPAIGHATARASNDRRLGIMADTLDTLQTRAERFSADAGSDPADPYTLTIAEMDLVAAGMAMLPFDTLGGVLLKLRAMAVPVVSEEPDKCDLPASVCRDVERLHRLGALS